MRKIFTVILLTIMLFLGENAMANNTLSAKQKSVATVASYAARGNQKGLKQALTEGLNAGLTVNELKEILVQVYAYCGFPRSLNALNTLMNLENERQNKDEQGAFSSVKPNDNSLEYGTKNQTKLIGQPVSGPLFEFAPAIDEYLKAHLFGDIFSRDNVDWQTRELATIAMLASLNNVTAQLNSHINIGKYNGLTAEQITEILEIADKTGAETVLFGFGQENTAYAKYFIGNSYLQPLTNDGVGAANVTFEPKARNNWHTHHHTGQTLFVVAGRGWYQEWGKPAQELKAGDVVSIPEGVKHWHGAAKDSWFTHIAVSVPNEGASTEWLEQVSDEEYNKLK
jgi:quercetin dioxygenase-like cupin family protein/alkylhydroperoxidase/carboxymuconolactone decarboxylase family protein YurZ